MKIEGQQARLAALELLEAVIRQKHPLEDMLENIDSFTSLNLRDRAFARNLVSTTLRRLGQIDSLIGHCLEKPLTKSSHRSHDILRLGICQLLFLGTADHAAVSSSVELAGQSGQAHAKKLVNAILRRIGRERINMLANQDESRLNVPDWLWHSWCKAYGETVARAISLAHRKEALLDLSVKSNPNFWAEKLDGLALPNGTVRLNKSRNITELEGFDTGEWWVQDTAARAAVQLLGNVCGKRVLDLCAAPGGKTAYLANAGAVVTAVDRSDRRLTRLNENLDRLKLSAKVITADVVDWRPKQKADAVLLDAPCSATGTIRKHPEVAWLKSEADITKLANLQTRLLDAAVEMVVPGGLILFATCSLQTEEGPDQIDSLISRNGSIKKLDVLRCLPSDQADLGGQDGFFTALLQYN
jgi:16S rRNA (cytosine967-C5)-methyltransferase